MHTFWAAIYNVVAIPLAAGALYPSLGVLLKPAWAALAMSASTVTVTLNALLLKKPGPATKSSQPFPLEGGHQHA